MTDHEKARQLLDELKACPETDISKYYSSAVYFFNMMPKADRNESAQLFYNYAEENAVKEPYKFAFAQFLLAVNHFFNDEFELTLQLGNEALRSFEAIGDDDGVAICKMGIAATYRTLGNYDLALKLFWEAFMVLRQSDKYPNSLLSCSNGMANINLELGNYDEAIEMFNITHEESEKAHDVYFNIYSLHGLGKVKMLQHNNEEAKGYFTRALQLATETNLPAVIAVAITESAKFYFVTGDLGEVEKLNKQALTIREEHNLISAAVTNCINLGELYIKEARWTDGIQVLKKGLALAEEIKVKPKIYQVHRLLSIIYKNTGDLEKSLAHFEVFHDLQREVEQAEGAQKLANAKMIFEAEQTKKENIIIKKQKKEIETKNIELQDTIDELTITRISRKAKVLTLLIAVPLFIFEDSILEFALHILSSDSYYISLIVKIGIVFSLNPIDKAIEHYLLRKVIKKRSRISEALA